MIVCIAEKPSVGRDIANVLGAKNTKDGYIEGNGYCVTWTFGHLCTLLEPQDYSDSWKAWSLSSLPMMPERFKIKTMPEKSKQKQLNTIKTLIEAADEVINCGDAGQEGELIQRWVMQQAGCKCPVKRLWISSLTEEAIKEGFAKLKAQSEYQHLYEAGMMRAIGDWLLGMNATRAYTLRYRDKQQQGKPLSIGRVQTPTLALIVNRQKEIEHFVPKTYWEIKTNYRNTVFNAIIRKEEDPQDAIGIDPILRAEDGQKLVDELKSLPFEVTSVEKKKGTESSPRLFDLTSLQVACNKKFGLTAEQTLNIAQSMYEKHITTYPRVDTTYLSDDIFPKCKGILRGIEPYFAEQIGGLRGNVLPKSKKVFDSTKVTDHHAIIPTGQAPNNLNETERKVFNLVALHFIAAFYPDCKIATTTVMGKSGEVPFKTTGRQIIEEGWRVVFKTDTTEKNTEQDKDKNQEDTQTLPDFKKGESGEHQPQLVEKQTTPPKYYTEATLLRAMETAGKFVEDEQLRDALKENGIGRPSTRSAIIEKLFDRNYIVRDKKNIKATQTGISLIDTIHTPLLKSAELTGQWEHKLRQIERGEKDATAFLDELKELTSQVVKEVKTSPVGMLCPVCRKGHIIRGNTAYGCSRWKEGCTYRQLF